MPNADFIPIDTECPQCGFKFIQQRTADDVQNQVTCGACGHVAALDKFITPAGRESLMKALLEIARDAFKDVPGFKSGP